LLVCCFRDESDEGHAEACPLIFGYDVVAVGGLFHAAQAIARHTEVVEDAAQFGTQPQGAYLAACLLEDKQSASLLWMVACCFYHAHQCVGAAVAIDIPRLELVDGVG